MKMLQNGCKRLLSFALSGAIAATLLPAGTWSRAEAAETGSDSADMANAAEAIGLPQSVPKGYEENNSVKNPYGKKTAAFGGADEVVFRQSDTKNFILGDDSFVGAEISDIGYHNSTQTVFADGDVTIDPQAGTVRSIFHETYISDIIVANDVEVIKNRGYQVIDVDLNKGAAGEYIYLGYTTTTNPNNAISDIVVKSWDSAATKEDETLEIEKRTYHMIDYSSANQATRNERGNLNTGANGNYNYVYVYYTKDRFVDDKSFTSPQADGWRSKLVKWIGVDSEEDGAVSGVNLLGGTLSGWNYYLHMEQEERAQVNAFGKFYESAESDDMYSNMLNKTAGGNFDRNTNGKRAQYAKIAYDSHSKKMMLGICDPIPGRKFIYKELGFEPDKAAADAWVAGMSADLKPTEKGNEQLTKTQLQSTSETLQIIPNFQIVSGDFDNNGVDEIAFYEPSIDNAARICVLSPMNEKGKITDPYDINTWTQIWALDVEKGKPVSLSAGDANNDGADDLVIGYGNEATVYLGSPTGALSKAVLLPTPTVYDPDVLVFTQFDANGRNSGNYVAVLGKNSDTHDRKAEATLSVYGINDNSEFKQISVKEKLELRQAGATGREGFLPLDAELHYMNGCLFSPYLQQGFSVNKGFLSARKLDPDVVPYAGSGVHPLEKDASGVMSLEELYNNYPCETAVYYDCQTACLNDNGKKQGTTFFKSLYIVNIKAEQCLVAQSLYGAYSEGVSNGLQMPIFNTAGFRNSVSDPCYAIVNIDDDSCAMTYTGRHWFEYTDPQVLAVLASPPYFKDLLETEGLSGSYADSSTSYAISSGSGDGVQQETNVSLGAFVTYEGGISAAGVPIFKIEAEIQAELTFSQEYSSVETTISENGFNTSAGQDSVVFYSIPMEFYEYETEINTVNENGKAVHGSGKKVVCFPKQPCIATISLEKYRSIAEKYPELPTIDSTVLDHTLGDPSTYPSSTAGYNNVLMCDFDSFMSVDCDDKKVGSGSESQTLSKAKDKQWAYSGGLDVSFRAGCGSGGVVAGIAGGVSESAGRVITSTEGSTFSAELFNMPYEANGFGYGMSWKMFTHEGNYTDRNDETVTFPVVDYIVTNVTQPPHIPENFRQNYQNSTQNSIALEWNYPNQTEADHFNLYRVERVNGETLSTLIGIVDVKEGQKLENGAYSYQFTDSGTDLSGGEISLRPGREYVYTIAAERSFSTPPPLSMMSNELKAYTSSDTEYPDVVLEGVSDGSLTIYPDKENYSVRAIVRNAECFRSIAYQWQEKDKKTNRWNNLQNQNKERLVLKNEDSVYRCRILAVTDDANVTAFTDDFAVWSRMRPVLAKDFTAVCKENLPELSLTVASQMPNCIFTPEGKVKFIIRQNGREVQSYTANLTDNLDKTSTAAADPEKIEALEAGVYQVQAYYSGDHIFDMLETEEKTLLVGESAFSAQLFRCNENEPDEQTDVFRYGDTMRGEIWHLEKDAAGTATVEKIADIAPKCLTDQPDDYTEKKAFTYQEEAEEVSYNYTIAARPIMIGMTAADPSQGDILDHLPQAVILRGDLVGDDKLEQLVTVQYLTTTGGKLTTPLEKLSASVYLAQPVPYEEADSRTAFYDMNLVSSKFTVTMPRYKISVKTEENEDGYKGTFVMSSPESFKNLTNRDFRFESGKELVLKAVPKLGYEFSCWEIVNQTTGEAEKINTSELSRKLGTDALDITARFNEKKGKITVDTDSIPGGSVEMPEGFVSGGDYRIGKEYTFTMQGDDNYVPDHWIKVHWNEKGRITTDYFSDSITVTVEEKPVTLVPVFKGAPCKLAFDSRIQAEYVYLGAQEEPIRMDLRSGGSVPKFSEITVSLKPNAKIGKDEVWKLNGTVIQPKDGKYVFTIKGDTEITIGNQPVETMPETTASTTETTKTTTATTTTSTSTSAGKSAQKTGTATTTGSTEGSVTKQTTASATNIAETSASKQTTSTSAATAPAETSATKKSTTASTSAAATTAKQTTTVSTKAAEESATASATTTASTAKQTTAASAAETSATKRTSTAPVITAETSSAKQTTVSTASAAETTSRATSASVSTHRETTASTAAETTTRTETTSTTAQTNVTTTRTETTSATAQTTETTTRTETTSTTVQTTETTTRTETTSTTVQTTETTTRTETTSATVPTTDTTTRTETTSTAAQTTESAAQTTSASAKTETTPTVLTTSATKRETTSTTTTTTESTTTTTTTTTTTASTTTTTTTTITTTTTSAAATTTTTETVSETTAADETTTKTSTSTTKASETTTETTVTTTESTAATTKVTETTTETTATTTKVTETTTETTATTTKVTETTTETTAATTESAETTTETTETTTESAETTTESTETTTESAETTTETTVTTTESAETISEPVETKPVEPDFLLGDVNEDGEVTVEDAQLTLIAYAAIVSGLDSGLTDRQVLAADIDRDKEVTAADAQYILLYYVRNTLSGETVTWEELLGADAQPKPLPERKQSDEVPF